MAKARIINIVATECPPEIEAKFNTWYNEVHIPMLMKYAGIKKVTRYKTIEQPGAKQRWLAIYEYDNKEDLNGMMGSPSFKAVREEMEATWKGQMFEVKWVVAAEPIKTWDR